MKKGAKEQTNNFYIYSKSLEKFVQVISIKEREHENIGKMRFGKQKISHSKRIKAYHEHEPHLGHTRIVGNFVYMIVSVFGEFISFHVDQIFLTDAFNLDYIKHEYSLNNEEKLQTYFYQCFSIDIKKDEKKNS